MTRVAILILLTAWASTATLAALYWWCEALRYRGRNQRLRENVRRLMRGKADG